MQTTRSSLCSYPLISCFVSNRYVIPYPELYLLCFILPWQLWFLCLALYPILPKALDTLILHQRLHYISTDGEIILLGQVNRKHLYKIDFYYKIEIQIISAQFGKSILQIQALKRY